MESEKPANSRMLNRRTLIRRLSFLPFLGVFGYEQYKQKLWESFEEKNLVNNTKDASTKLFKTVIIKELKGNISLTAETVRLIKLTIEERSGARCNKSSEECLKVILRIDKLPGKEGYHIEYSDSIVRITGNDPRGLLYGAGRFLRECSFAQQGLTYSGWTGTSVPVCNVRGIYFATHFHNFYHDAPVNEVVKYVEELALWGCNSLMVWFDMHHYSGIDDPAATIMIERLRTILLAANRVGIGVGILFLANEGYKTTPKNLRVTPGPMQYNVEICPSKPGGTEFILKLRRELLERFADINVEYVCIWPHDQGGCGCKECNPWGGKGFVELSRQLKPLVNEVFPNAKIILSTWCFDIKPEFITGEYEGLWKALEKESSLADYCMVDAHDKFPSFVLDHGKPANIPIINFTEISMMGMTPWGGFGQNPLPQHIDRMWQPSRHLMSGGFPYSEGIFEDVNKAIMLQLYWDPGRQVRDIIREYAAYEWSRDHSESLTNVVMRLGEGAQWEIAKELHVNVFTSASSIIKGDEAAPQGIRCYDLPRYDASRQNSESIARALQTITPFVASSWRWRTLWLRVMIEDSLRRSDGVPTGESDSYFEELISIYHAQNADGCIYPPSSRLLAGLIRNAGQKR